MPRFNARDYENSDEESEEECDKIASEYLYTYDEFESLVRDTYELSQRIYPQDKEFIEGNTLACSHREICVS